MSNGSVGYKYLAGSDEEPMLRSQSRIEEVDGKDIFVGTSVYLSKILQEEEYELSLDHKVEGYRNRFHMNTMLILVKVEWPGADFYVNISRGSDKEFNLYTGNTSQVISTKHGIGKALNNLLPLEGDNVLEDVG